jgi:hypothetical protein
MKMQLKELNESKGMGNGIILVLGLVPPWILMLFVHRTAVLRFNGSPPVQGSAIFFSVSPRPLQTFLENIHGKMNNCRASGPATDKKNFLGNSFFDV